MLPGDPNVGQGWESWAGAVDAVLSDRTKVTCTAGMHVHVDAEIYLVKLGFDNLSTYKSYHVKE